MMFSCPHCGQSLLPSFLQKRGRRWLSFSVRTLLVAVTALCIWLGWQVQVVRQRSLLVREIKADNGHVLPWDQTAADVVRLGYGPEVIEKRTGYQEWYSSFGDVPVQRIFINWRVRDWKYREKVARLFPEAEVHPFSASYWYDQNQPSNAPK